MSTAVIQTGSAARLGREEAFHDGWARGVDLRRVKVREQFEGPAAPENKFILRWFGELRGKRVLDLACGLGESSVYFALQGARVTALDLSGEMLGQVRRLGELHGVEVETVKGNAERPEVESGAYDLVYGANMLHHCEMGAVAREVRRVLRAGGRAAFIDPLPHNPVINVYRRLATRVRTADERPLGLREARVFREHFGEVRQRQFWLTALAVFCKFYVWDGVDPNEERYWKKVIYEGEKHAWLLRPAMAVDAVLARVWPLNLLCWNNVILVQ